MLTHFERANIFLCFLNDFNIIRFKQTVKGRNQQYQTSGDPVLAHHGMITWQIEPYLTWSCSNHLHTFRNVAERGQCCWLRYQSPNIDGKYDLKLQSIIPGVSHAWDILWLNMSLQRRHSDHDGVSNHQPHGCLLNRLFRRRSKKTSKLRVTGLCAGNSPVAGEFPAQRASNAENVFIWWRHHEKLCERVQDASTNPAATTSRYPSSLTCHDCQQPSGHWQSQHWL